MISTVQDFSSWNDHSSSLKSAYMDRPLRCYGFLIDKGQGICLRANNLHAYIELNRKIERILPSVAPNVELNLVHVSSEVNEKSQVNFLVRSVIEIIESGVFGVILLRAE